MTPTTTLARLAALALLSTAAPAALAQATTDAPAPAPGATEEAPAPGQAPAATGAQPAEAVPVPATDVQPGAQAAPAPGTDAQAETPPDTEAAPTATQTEAQPAETAPADAPEADAVPLDTQAQTPVTPETPATDQTEAQPATGTAPAPDAQPVEDLATDAPEADATPLDTQAETPPATQEAPAPDQAEATPTPEAQPTDDVAAEAPETDAPETDAPDADPQAAAAAGEALEPAEPTEEMQAVLDQLAALGAEPLGTRGVEETRAQPTPADAVMALMEEQGIDPDPEQEAVLTRDLTIPGAAGEIPARVYTPSEGEGPFPLIVYFHGGGWVIADIDTYDATPRALAAATGAVVLSASYRQAPENPFPAAHEDAVAAYVWAVENSGSLNADANRVALAGESAGGNLAINVAIEARDRQLIQPVHQLLVYPVAGNDMTTPSYEAYADAEPLSREGMEWFVEQVFASMEETEDPRINLVERDDLGELPPTTIVLAEIDPLLSEGETLAERLEEAGVEVEQRTFERVAHEFFGMGAVVPEAEEAVAFAAERLRADLGADE